MIIKLNQQDIDNVCGGQGKMIGMGIVFLALWRIAYAPDSSKCDDDSE